jgi:RIO-like serine/threonine protein kinase
MMQLLKELKGHSGATVTLYDNNTVVKSRYSKARQSVKILEDLPFKTPSTIEVTDDRIVMEYIKGEDIASYLECCGNEGVDNLIKFIESYFDWCLSKSCPYSFENELQDKALELGPVVNLSSLIDTLDYKMPQSLIHGDFTFDNIIHKDGEFYLIDSNPTCLNSIYFDGAKLRQDIDGFWFLRDMEENLKTNIKISCLKISEHLKLKYAFMNDNNLYAFMLYRILPYCKDESTTEFLTREIDRIWPL